VSNPSVTQNDHIVLTNRGHLTTLNQYNPDTYGGIIITGQWTFTTANDDFSAIVTRSDGTVGDWGEVANGLEFRCTPWSSQPLIVGLGSNLTFSHYQTFGSVTYIVGTVYNFTIIDKGAGGLSYTITQASNPSNTITAIATLDTDTEASNYVVFYNREKDGEVDRVSNLDNVTISTVPEPASMFLVGAGLVGLLWRRRR